MFSMFFTSNSVSNTQVNDLVAGINFVEKGLGGTEVPSVITLIFIGLILLIAVAAIFKLLKT